jgi:hypothetical protein
MVLEGEQHLDSEGDPKRNLIALLTRAPRAMELFMRPAEEAHASILDFHTFYTMDSKHLGVLLHPNCVTAMLRGLITQTQLMRLNDHKLSPNATHSYLFLFLRGHLGLPAATATEYGILPLLRHLPQPLTDESLDWLFTDWHGMTIRKHLLMLDELKSRQIIEQDFTIRDLYSEKNKGLFSVWWKMLNMDGM